MTRSRDNADHYSGSTSASDLASGTLAAARLPVHSIIQIVQNDSETQVVNTTSTWETAVSKEITLSSATNKVLAIGTARGELRDSGSAYGQGGIRMRSSSSGTDQTIDHNPGGDAAEPYGLTGDVRWSFIYTMSYLFEPDYLGAVTIYMEGRVHNTGNDTMYLNMTGSSGYNTHSQILLMEVVAT